MDRRLHSIQPDIEHCRHHVIHLEGQVDSIKKDIDHILAIKNDSILRLRQEEVQAAEATLRFEADEEKDRRRETEMQEYIGDIDALSRNNENLRMINDKLRNEREKYIAAANNIASANTDIEKELDDIVQHDENIRHSLEQRDRKVSPVIYQNRQ